MKVPLYLRLLPSAAVRAWFTPPPLPAHVAAADAAATRDLERFELAISGGTVTGLAVGDGPLVLALHGWGGRAAQMAPVARHLAEGGYRVLAPEMPGRAGSERTDLLHYVATADALLEKAGHPFGVIAHSLGALAIRLWFTEAAPPVVMVAPALDVTDSLQTFARRLRLAPWTDSGLRRRLRQWNPAVFERVSGLHPDQLGDAEVLVVHDPSDRQAPFSTAAALAALRPRTHLVAVEGAGHNGALAHPRTLEEAAAFFARMGSMSAGVSGDDAANPTGGG